MIIGSGLIAKAFHKYKNNKDVLIFASGVSNSKSCSISDCNREEQLARKILNGNNNQSLVVYFSSCSLSSTRLKNDAYHKHKKKMEGLFKVLSKRRIIFRLPNVVGNNANPDTLFYYLVSKIRQQEEFDLWTKNKRNIIDIDDVVKVASYIIDNNIFKGEVINIANINDNTVDDIVRSISKYFEIQANFSIVEFADNYKIDTSKIKSIVKKLNVKFGDEYLDNIVRKYCEKP